MAFFDIPSAKQSVLPAYGTGVAGGLPNIATMNPLDLQFGTNSVNVINTPTMPGIDPRTGGMFGKMTGVDKVNAALGGLQTIGGLWAAFQSAKMAKKQFNFTKKTTEANMANQIQSYNTALADRARSRAVVEGQDAATSAAYIDKNKLPAYRG